MGIIYMVDNFYFKITINSEYKSMDIGKSAKVLSSNCSAADPRPLFQPNM